MRIFNAHYLLIINLLRCQGGKVDIEILLLEATATFELTGTLSVSTRLN